MGIIKVTKKNCLTNTFPKIAKEWHPTKNGDLTPDKIYHGSHLGEKPHQTKVWWKCPKGADHEYPMPVYKRTQGGESGCSICSGHRVVPSISLKVCNPKISKEWHPTKNDPLTPETLTSKSSRKVKWRCTTFIEKDNSWEAIIQDRTKRGDKCPYCSGEKVTKCKKNSLKYTHPKLAQEWHHSNLRGPENFTSIRRKDETYYWKCKKNPKHIYKSQIYIRVKGHGCNICTGKVLIQDRCFANTHPHIVKDWHPTKNYNKNPNDYFPSSPEMINWICKKEHEWLATINNRTNKYHSSGCPDCSDHGFDRLKDATFYIRRIDLNNGKVAIKYGITNQKPEKRAKELERGLQGNLKTITLVKCSGFRAVEIENKVKDLFSIKPYLIKSEMPYGFTETIIYSKENLFLIKSLYEQ